MLALARECDLEEVFTIDRFHEIGERVPLIGNLSPHGPYHMSDLHHLGGVPIVMRELLNAGLVRVVGWFCRVWLELVCVVGICGLWLGWFVIGV